VFAITSYAVTLTERELLFDRRHGASMARYPQCRLSKGTCTTSDARLTYDLPPHDCPYTFLREIKSRSLYGYNLEQKEPLQVKPPMILRNMSYFVKSRSNESLVFRGLPVVVIDEGTGIVLLRKKRILACSEPVYQTNYPNLFLSKFRLRNLAVSVPEGVDLSRYFNMKIDFAAFTLHERLKSVYYDVVQRICKLRYEMLRNKLTIATKHPELAGRLMTDQPGVYGMVAGEALYFSHVPESKCVLALIMVVLRNCR